MKNVIASLVLVAVLAGPLHHRAECPTDEVCDWSSPMLNSQDPEIHTSAAIDLLVAWVREADRIYVSGTAHVADEFRVRYEVVR